MNAKQIEEWIKEIENVIPVYENTDGTKTELPEKLLMVFNDIYEQVFIPLVSRHLEKKFKECEFIEKQEKQSSEEMFKELGYEYRTYNANTFPEKNIIQIVNDGGKNGTKIIDFYESKTYRTNLRNIDIPLHKAINQQLKELGWL